MDLTSLTSSERDSKESAILRRLLPLLTRLRQDPEAAALAAPLERALAAHVSVRSVIDRALLDFLDTLLGKHARASDASASVRLAARLAARQRQASTDTDQPRPAARRVDADSPDADALQQHLIWLLWATSRTPVRTDTTTKHDNAEQLHQFRRQRDGLDASMSSLASALARAEADSNDLVAHIKQVRLAIAPTADTTPESYGLLVGATEELVRGQDEIAARLRAAHELLTQVRGGHRELGLAGDALLQHAPERAPGLARENVFLERLHGEMRRAERFHSPLSLAIIVPERAEAPAKVASHTASDEITRCYAEQVLGAHRAYDMVVRHGAQEFAWLLPNTGQYEALSALRNAQQRVARTRYQWDGHDWPAPDFYTGLTRYRPGDTAATLVERADRAAQRARESGKQRVAVE
jgi:diguanylate cyclase (GGDEF)-like protein